MNRFRLATLATLAGAMLAAGCASPCGGCGGVFRRMSMFRGARNACPCECCSSCGGGAPIVGAGPDLCEGPLLEPEGPPMSAGAPPMGMGAPPMGMGAPAPFPPNLGAPMGPPPLQADPGRINPIPNAASPFPAGPSSRRGSR